MICERDFEVRYKCHDEKEEKYIHIKGEAD